MARHRVLGISFDHIHMGDLLRLVAEHPDAEIAGIHHPHPVRMRSAIANFAIPQDRVFTDLEACLATTRADLAIVCSKPPSMRTPSRRSPDTASTSWSRSPLRQASPTRGG